MKVESATERKREMKLKKTKNNKKTKPATFSGLLIDLRGD